MNITLWTWQGLLALVFLTSGLLKATQSKERLVASGQTGVADFSPRQIRFIAICELLGAAGLVAPTAMHIYPILTPIAALGLGIIMLLASRIHFRLHEPRNVAINFVILAMCIAVAYGRVQWP